MSVVFRCSHCGSERTAAHYVQGRRVRCPDCDQMVEVPMNDGLSDESLPDDDVAPAAASAAAEPLQVAPQTAAAVEARLRAAPPAESAAPAEPPEPTGAFRKPRKRAEAEMDMTPMVDVTFLLLIFFMVTAAFAVQKAKEIPKPEPPEEGAQARSFQVLEDDPDYVTIHVDEYGTYRVTTVDWDRPAFSTTELMQNLKEARAGSSGGHVPKHLLVRAHGDALHEKVVTALDAGNEVGMDDVQLLTHEEEE